MKYNVNCGIVCCNNKKPTIIKSTEKESTGWTNRADLP